MRKWLIVLLIAIIFLGSGAALAVPGTRVFLPMVASAGIDPAPDSLSLPAGYSGMIDSVPLAGGRLVVLIMVGDTNVQAYVYDPNGGYSITDGFEVSGKPSRIDIRGCIWVVSESTDWNFITVHKVRLPADSVCED